jgi:hypothetical protein
MVSTPLKGITNRGLKHPFWRNIMGQYPTRKVVHRDAKDGQFVTEKYADKHPATTEREHVYVPAPKPPKK